MINNDATMGEKADVLRNDLRAREQGSTYHAHTHNDVGGRFAEREQSTVVGSTPSPASQYPAGPAWSAVELPPEPSLGVSIDDMPPVGEPREVRKSIEANQPPLSSLATATQEGDRPGPTSQGTPGPTSDAPPFLVGVERGVGSGSFRRF